METRKALIMVAAIALLALSLIAIPVWGDKFARPSLSPSVPTVINYQGRLANASGRPLTGTYHMVFSIWDTETVGTGTRLWGPEAHPNVQVTDGLFNIPLGSLVPISASVFAGPSTYLQVEVEGETLSPRQPITSVGYAFQAENADTVDGKHASDFVSASLVGSSNAYEADTIQDVLLSMSTTGWTVRDDGDVDSDHTLILSTTDRIIEYTLWYGGTVVHGEALLGNPATITFPHYQGFQLILARHWYIASLTCNENDSVISCLYHKSNP